MFKLSAVKKIEVPHYEELSVKNMMAAYSRDEKFMAYMPEVRAKGKVQHRQYMFDVFNSLYPETLAKIIKEAKMKRSVIAETEEKKETILMNEDWIKELKSVPFKSSKLLPGVNMYIGAHGRTIFLLKAKAKSSKPRA